MLKSGFLKRELTRTVFCACVLVLTSTARAQQVPGPHSVSASSSPVSSSKLSGSAVRVIGPEASAAFASGSRERTGWGGSLSERGVGLLNHGVFSARYFDLLRFGGDNHGVLYHAEANLGAGLRLRPSLHHALFVRAAGGLRVQQVSRVYASAVHIPELQSGYQYTLSRTLVELAASGGYSPWRRFHVAGRPSNLDSSWSLGGVLTLSRDAWRLDANWRASLQAQEQKEPAPRITNSSTSGGAAQTGTEVSANLCYLWTTTALCSNAQYLSSTFAGQRRSTELLVAGLAIQLGQMQWLD